MVASRSLRRVATVALAAAALGGGFASPTLASGRWRIVSSPSFGRYSSLTAVSAVSANDAWAVGLIGAGTATQSLALHWDGTSWTKAALPIPRGGASLDDVLALRSNDVWAVGTRGTDDGRHDRTLIEHWDGAAWSVVPSPNPAKDDDLYHIVKGTHGQLWAIGVTIIQHTFGGLIERWDGGRWRVVTSPNRDYDTFLWGATGVPGGQPWAFGWSDTGHGGDSLAEHWNGRAWTIVGTPNRRPCYCALQGAAATSRTDVWAVGNGPPKALIEHWDGAVWTLVHSPAIGDYSSLYGAVATAKGSAWAVGSYWDGVASWTLAEHWNGARWSVVSSPNVGDGVELQRGRRRARDRSHVGGGRVDFERRIGHADRAVLVTSAGPAPR